MTWSTAELSELHYSHLEVGAQEQRGEWKGFHSSLVASSPGCGVSEEELSWAMGVAYSRAFRQVEDQSRTAVFLLIDDDVLYDTVLFIRCSRGGGAGGSQKK